MMENPVGAGSGPPRCDACLGTSLDLALDLGNVPRSDGFLDARALDRHEPTVPLRVQRCGDCGLMMLAERLPKESLFGADYLYSSAISGMQRAHLDALARTLIEELRLGPGDSVVEVACNDGYLLEVLRTAGLAVLGVEPAPQPAKLCKARGVATIERFLEPALAAELRAAGHRPRVVIANNVLAHNARLDDLAAALATLAGEASLVVEVGYLGDLLTNLAFDTIYPEHCFYFSLSALCRLFERHGLGVERLQRIATQGGSLRLFLRRGAMPDDSVTALLGEEARGSLSRDRVGEFARRVHRLRRQGRTLLGRLKAQGKRIAAYGAAAKGTMLLNQLGLDGRFVDYVVDRNPLKQGRWVPGVRLPIVGCERLAADPPDFLLVLPWNLAAEIRAQERDWERAGGRFILPLPAFEIWQ
jgi:hypothetical protein